MKLRLLTSTFAALVFSATVSHAQSLQDIYELALENDAQLKAYAAQFRADREQETLAKSALLPQVGASYDYNETETSTVANSLVGLDANGNGIIEEIESFSDTTSKGYTVSLSQALFDLPAWFTFQASKSLSEQAEATFAAQQQDLIVRVSEAYFGVLRAKDNLEASKAQERALERQLEQTQQRFEVGLIALTDVHEAQAAFDLARVGRLTDENRLDVALENLSVLTNVEHERLFTLSSDFPVAPPEPADRAAWVDFALENNLQLKASRLGETAAQQNAKAKRLEHAPTISGSFSTSDFETEGVSRQDSIFNVPPRSDREQDVVRLRLEVPLFAGGAISANRRRAAEQFNAARESRIGLQRNTIAQTRALHMTVLSDAARVKARAQAIVSSKSALEATQAGYNVGTRNVVDVLNAQNALYAAERDYANTRYDYVLNQLRLKQQAGLLSPKDVADLSKYLEAPKAVTQSGQ
ncbi:TolC family outer membrane protein [Aequoribacter sp.]|uniref:TolC family outer membrane protein n=1 Tax=Aequoribacter sp. TaxID=2847771 RepID=UPI003F69D578